MKFALYLIASCLVTQWQDDEITSYDPPGAGFARIEMAEPPPDFDVNVTPSGWWVVADVLTQTEPPSIENLALQLTWDARRIGWLRYMLGVPTASGPMLAPEDYDFTRIAAIVASPSDLITIDIKLNGGTAWTRYLVADLLTAFPEFVKLREQCWAREREHVEIVNGLRDAGDRPALEAYDATTGFPA